MNNGNDSTTSPTALDGAVDQAVPVTLPNQERYNESDGGTPFSKSPNFPSDANNGNRQSSILAEIERSIANDILPVRQQRLAVFGLTLNRKNDFRLKELNHRLDNQLRREHEKEIKTGAEPVRLRGYDIQAQALRQITANSALGSLQFQKTHVLPYMRKSLALSYQRTHLLKKTVGSIQSLEASLVSKLEAIKLNTGAVVPEKKSFIVKLRDAVKAKSFDRIATNISNVIMDRHDAIYREKVSPILAKLHKTMKDTSRKGGVNGVVSGLRTKLNTIRHQMEKVAERDPSTMSTAGKIQQAAAKIGTGVAGAAIRLGQKARLSFDTNKAVSKQLEPYTEMLDKVKPFGNPNAPGAVGGMFEDLVKPVEESVPRKRAIDRVLDKLQDFNEEAAHRQIKMLDHVKAIRESIAPRKPLLNQASKRKGTSKRTKAPKGSLPSQSVTPKPFTVSGKFPKMGTGMAVGAITPKSPAIPTFTRRIGQGMVTFGAPPSVTNVVGATAAKVAAAPGPWGPKMLPAAATGKPDAQQSMFTKLFGALSSKLDSVNTTIKSGDSEQIKLERDQIKHQSWLEKAAARAKIRKGSYEELMAQRAAAKASAGGNMGPWGPRGALAGAGLAAAGASGSDSEGGGILSSLKDKAMSLFEDKIDSLGEKDDDAPAEGKKGKGRRGRRAGRGGRAGRAGRSAGAARGGLLRRGLSATGRGAGRGAKGLLGMAGKTLKGATKLGFKGAWGATKLGGRGIGKVGMGALKLGGKGALALGKSGLGLGLAAGAAQMLFDKSGVTGGAKSLVDTGLSMATYGGMGMTVGGPIGAAIGAAVGLVVANADKASSALSSMASGAASAGKGMWSFIFGQNAIVKDDGTVVQREKSSILGDLKIAILGRKARYSASGEIIATERGNILGNIQYGFEKLLFGDKFSNGQYKEGTSLLAMARTGISDALTRFGKDIAAIPGNVRKDVTNLAAKAAKFGNSVKNATAAGATASGNYIVDKGGKAKTATFSLAAKAADLYKNFSLKRVGEVFTSSGGSINNAIYYASPTGFAVGASAAIFGWNIEESTYTTPGTPTYAFVTEVLSAYGVKDRVQYRFIHSLELSQEKVNKGQTKPFDDADMTYMAERFGFDPKNKESVNYFKLWYKRRFIPGMAIIGRVLSAHRMNFGSVLGADPKEITKITEELKKELGGTDLKSMRLEPTPQAYNKYAKIGSSDPGKVTATSLTKSKMFDPRAPENKGVRSLAQRSKMNFGSQFDVRNGGGGDEYSEISAARKKAQMTKGGIKDQPEFKAAYAKLPANLRKAVDKSKSLQFVLWSTSVQHGPDMASQIFQRDYTEGADERSIIKKIYQDRSSQFGALNGDDRSEATSHLGEEQRIALGIQDGSQTTDRETMGNILGNVIDPSGSFGSYNGPAAPIRGKVKDRARIAMQFFMERNYNKEAAAGIVGNLIDESGLRTNAEGDYKPGTRIPLAKGIAQWHADRRGPIAQKFGRSVEAMSLPEQLAAVDWEIRGGGRGGVGKGLPEALNNAGSAQRAAVIFMQRFERPLDHASNGKNARTRSATALGVLRDMGTAGAIVGKPNPGGATPPAPGTRGVTPAAPPRPSAPKSNQGKPASKKTAPDPQHAQAWSAGLDGHTSAMREMTESIRSLPEFFKQGGKMGDTNNVAITPLMPSTQKRSGGFIQTSVKKSVIAAGTQ